MADEVKLRPREIREASFPIAGFLSEEEQAKYEEASNKFNNQKARTSLNVPRNGSNLWKVLLLNQIGIRTASLEELESAYENGLSLQGHYEDAPAVVLRSAGDSYAPNDYLAKNLVKQLGVKEFKAPLVVEGLEVIADDNSDYGLSFKRTDKTQVIEALDLSHGSHQRKFSRINPNYSIEFDENGNRTLWTRQEGVSRLCLGGYLGLNSGSGGLAGSYDVGRVVVVNDAEGAPQKFLEEHSAKLQQERDRQISDIQERYAKADAILRGG